MNKAAMANMLLSMRAQIDALLDLLGEGGEQGCQHPPDQRLNLTVLGGPDQWQCRACGYQHTEPD